MEAKTTNDLRDKLDIKEFHNQVLATGSIPLNLLEVKIDHWIDVSKS